MLNSFGRNPPYYNRALLYHNADGKAILNFSLRLLLGNSDSPRTPGIPCLTEDQIEALSAIHFIAQKHKIDMLMKKGDLRFINNMSMVHCREAFEDDDNNHRHLIRLWLSNQTEKWTLDPELEVAWARVFDDRERETHWDAMPIWLNGKIIKAESCD
jgi:Taurine catabolism dioxygenase TauD, TfdA family